MESFRLVRRVSLGFLLAASVASAWAERPNDYRTEAYRRYNAGLYREAIRYFDSLLQRKHRDIEAHVKRGNCYLRLNRPDLAMVDYNSVILFNRFYPPAYTDRGIAFLMLGQLAAAESDFAQSLQLYNSPIMTFDPASSGYYDSSWNVPTIVEPLNWDIRGIQRALAHSGLGQVYHRLGQDARAVAEYDASLNLNPNDANPYVGRGDALASLGQLAPAIATFDQALRLAPQHSRAYASRGAAFSRVGEMAKALSDLDHAINLDPDYVYARRLRAGILSASGQNLKALEDLDMILRLDPKDAGALKDRGGVLVRMGKPEQALEALAESLRIDPRRASAYLNQGVAYQALGRHEQAIRAFDEAIRLDPSQRGAWTDRGLAHASLGQAEPALGDFAEALRIDPKNAIPYVGRAEVYARLGRHTEALADYETAHHLAPQAPSALVGLGQACDALGRYDQAIDAYTKALQLVPLDAPLLVARGNSRRMQRDWEGAIADFTQALVRKPRDADAHALRGWTRLIADRDGADEDARAYLELRRGADKSAPFMAILGALAARRVHHDHEAEVFLDEAIANTSSIAWPTPVLHFLKHKSSPEDLLNAAKTSGQKSEAHAFLALDRLYSGDKLGAADHFRWLSEHGAESPIALDLAHEGARRLNGANPPVATAGRTVGPFPGPSMPRQKP